MVTRNIELTDEQNRRLEELAAALQRSVSELIRERIEEVLKADARPSEQDLRRRAAALSGRFRSGLTDLSTEHDRYLEDSFQN